jgi:glucose-1-phosphate thymidylyltransferase
MKKLKGILLAGGRGTRLAPVSTAINKHLLPIYDKPMFYYPLSTLMLSGVREIALISDPKDLSSFQKLLGDGTRLGIEITYFAQPDPNGLPEAFTITEEFLNGDFSALILGDNLLFGPGYGRSLQKKTIGGGASIFAFPVENPKDYGVIEINQVGKVISLEEKPLNPKSNLAIPGFYFFDGKVSEYAHGLKPSKRGELEIIDLLRVYLELGKLEVEIANRGTSWLDAGTTENLFTASELVKVTQNRQGYKINVPEEIAFESGWITLDELVKTAQSYKNSPYGDYLFSVASRAKSDFN